MRIALPVTKQLRRSASDRWAVQASETPDDRRVLAGHTVPDGQ
ncbi:hypothetical protein [Halobellus sp. Atlit-38R]|nr:hypothetical protein [Halobellus sp. Atlit-38R]